MGQIRKIVNAHLLGLAVLVGLAGGCSGIDKLRGDGFDETENWGNTLRTQGNERVAPGGVSTKAQQIERNLGVK